MSARQRRSAREGMDVFSTSAILTPQETDAAIFDSIVKIDAGRQVAKPVSIFDIRPDPAQPRRAIPSPLRPVWDGKPSSLNRLFGSWLDMAVRERGQQFRIEPFLVADEDVQRPMKIGPIESALFDIIELASNIRSNGLTNPITIAGTQNNYRLETGERRWLAYHLLHAYLDEERETWARVPARIVEDGLNVWRQASENSARANLNAIGKARQFAILLMDLYSGADAQFLPFDQMVTTNTCDRAFYAQVADGDRFPIPRGKGELVLNAMGFRQQSQLREHRSLLRLPDEVWRLADDLNWAYGRIRSLQRSSGGDDSDLVEMAYRAADAEHYTVGIPTLDPPALPHQDISEGDVDLLFSLENRKRFNKLWRRASRVGEGDPTLAVAVLADIREMRMWLDELEKLARSQLRSQK